MDILLSFIIPTYNIEDKIIRCLESIERIPLSKDEYEVLIIDDASTDHSAQVSEEWLTKAGIHHQVIVQEKAGQATGRNRGLTLARGKWIWMVDGDDEIVAAPLMFQHLLSDQVDLITFNYDEIWPDRHHTVMAHAQEVTMTGVAYLAQSHGGSYLWNKIYRREATQGIKFIDGLTHIEDMCFNIHALTTVGNVLCLPVVGYRYYRNPKKPLACDARIREREKANRDSFAVYLDLRELANTLQDDSARAVRSKLNFDVLAHIYTIFLYDNKETLKEYLFKYKDLGLYPFHKTGNLKADMFRLVANHPLWLFLLKTLRTLVR